MKVEEYILNKNAPVNILKDNRSKYKDDLVECRLYIYIEIDDEITTDKREHEDVNEWLDSKGYTTEDFFNMYEIIFKEDMDKLSGKERLFMNSLLIRNGRCAIFPK